MTFDVLIIDEGWAFISFPVIGPAVSLQTGLVFGDQPALARELAEWFDQRVRESAISYEAWRSANGQP